MLANTSLSVSLSLSARRHVHSQAAVYRTQHFAAVHRDTREPRERESRCSRYATLETTNRIARRCDWPIEWPRAIYRELTGICAITTRAFSNHYRNSASASRRAEIAGCTFSVAIYSQINSVSVSR